jgi:Restriction endonuclease
MSIFDGEPADWKDLQQMVGQMFSEMDCVVRVGERVGLVRGGKEIDVYVRDDGVAPPAQYLCECKLWKKAIPQEVVHSFRTVVADYGANIGFIISSGPFQHGAHEAAVNTNVQLVTFAELQEIFFDRWRVAMGHRFMPYADRLFPYWDYPGRMPKIKWGKEHVERQQEFIEAYRPLVQLGPLSEQGQFRQTFPIILPRLNEHGERDGEFRINSYRQYFDFIDANKDLALYRFQVLYGEV